jgi:hypothetical protein
MAHDEHPALERILRQPSMREAFRLLSEDLSGADLTSLLLEVVRLRSEDVTPAGVMRHASRDRFVKPSAVPFERLRAVEEACLRALPAEFDLVVLSPLAPLGTHSSIAPVDQNNVVSTIRSTEVAADPTNGLALLAASRRRGLLARDARSSERVSLAALQRVIRGQRFDEDGRSFSHFELFGLVTAGRDVGDLTFESRSALQHLRIVVAALTALDASAIRLELTDLAGGRFGELVEQLRSALEDARVEVAERPDRPSGRNYYDGFCFKAFPTFGSETFEVADGGFVDWTRKLVGNEKERLLISGIGLDRLALA